MPLSIRPLNPVFAGEVTGVDCRRPLGRGEVAAIEAGMDEYAVLVFPEQELSDAEQIAFTRHFGELERNSRAGHIRKNEDHRLGPGIADFSNLDKSGALMSAEDRVVLQARRPAVAFRQLVPPGPGQVFAIVGPGRPVLGRQHRIRRHARRL